MADPRFNRFGVDYGTAQDQERAFWDSYASASEPTGPKAEIRQAPPFSLGQWLWQQALQREGLQFADRTIGRPTNAEDRPIAIGDFGVIPSLIRAGDAAYASSQGADMSGTIGDMTFGLVDAFPAAALGRSAVRGILSRPSIGEQAAQTYMVGQRLSAPSSYKSVAGKPSTVEMPSGEKFEARPISEIENAARKYMADRGMDTKGFDSYPPFSEERARVIAAAYDMMANDPTNPAVRRAYDAMVQETLDQYSALKDSGIEFKFLQEGMQDPYAASPALGYQDLVENGRLWVFPTDFGYGADTGADYFDATANPLLKRVGTIGDKQDAVANDAFRAVHDAFGHFGSGNPFFRRQGEERAFLEHSRMYSPEARGAMTSETRGQNSWLNSGPYGLLNRTANTGDTVFADQKIGLMPSWTWEARGMPSPEEAGILQRYITGAGWK